MSIGKSIDGKLQVLASIRQALSLNFVKIKGKIKALITCPEISDNSDI